ncbi:MAG: serine/threonine protein kinase [Nanoarchaeota archaeon]|nr:serine/threonine protein kinase [Nanoarchaeota archaeon]
MAQSFIPIKKFIKEPYSKILGYPKATPRQLQSRVSELEKLKIKSVSLIGQTTIGNLQILGKGYVGVVVLAKKRNNIVALKIRRTDSQRSEMQSEAKLLKLTNTVNVGPKLYDVSKNFLVMEYLDGDKIGDWIQSLKGVGSSKKLKSVVRNILEDCYRLDQMGFDHGELSSITKHVIVGKLKPTIIDFESSSVSRRASNVTSVTQAIFIGSGIAKKVQRIYKIPQKEKIIDVLRAYKQEQTRKSFDNILKILKL